RACAPATSSVCAVAEYIKTLIMDTRKNALQIDNFIYNSPSKAIFPPPQGYDRKHRLHQNNKE
ncbi:hypothetical protein OFN94_35215, partial [Escherichia coli]|nr:hypothetical protein [Escherichia coli]